MVAVSERPKSRFGSGRSRPAEYWSWVAGIMISNLLLSLIFHGTGAVGGTLALWIITYRRRLHDIGRSGWWTAGMLLVATTPLLAGALTMGPSFATFFRQKSHDFSTPQGHVFVFANLAAITIQLAFTIWLGLKKGDPGENRYGPPPVSRRGQHPPAPPPAGPWSNSVRASSVISQMGSPQPRGPRTTFGLKRP